MNVDAVEGSGDEHADLLVAVREHPESRRLHTAGREAGHQPPAQQPRYLVADHPVEEAASEPRTHQRLFDRPRTLERLVNRRLGDLRKGDPTKAVRVTAEKRADRQGDWDRAALVAETAIQVLDQRIGHWPAGSCLPAIPTGRLGRARPDV